MRNTSQQFLPSGLFAIVLSVWLPLLALAADASLVVTKIDGTKLSGELIAWNAAELTLQTENQTVTIASPQLLRVQWRTNSPSKTYKATFLELTDNTRLPHLAYVAEQGQATINTPLAEHPITISTEQVAFVQLSTDAPDRDEIDRELDGDLLVVHKKKKASFDQLSGVISTVLPEQIEFIWDGESISVKRSKIAAMAYFHADSQNKKEPVCWLNLQGGARLPAAEISLQDQDLRVRTSGGLVLSFASRLLRDADYSVGKIAYLSDLKPIDQRWMPLIDLPTSAELIRHHGLPRSDQSFEGSALALRWPAKASKEHRGELKTYSKGLAMRSRTESRYRLPEGMRRFVAIAGIDPETSSQGNVTLEIFADRRLVWQGEIDGSAAPTDIHIELGDARELRIVVDYGKNLDFGDRLHLAEARVIR